MKYDTVVIGAGPAGMMSAISSAAQVRKTALIEKNAIPGKKLLLTGKGRCNLTNKADIGEIIEQFGKKGRFLLSSFSVFDNQRLIEFFEQRGVGLKTERGRRVFPVSDSSDTIQQTLVKELKKQKVSLMLNSEVKDIINKDKEFTITTGDTEIKARKIVIATGGLSYPATGSTGDGYKWALSFGHTIKPELKPALNGLIVKNKDITQLAGLSLKNIRLSFYLKNQKKLSFFGEMLFTHKGISGPIVLPASEHVFDWLKQGQVVAQIDFKPALTKDILKKRIYRDIHLMPKKEFTSLLKNLLPASIIPLFIKSIKADKHSKNSALTPQQVEDLIVLLKNFKFEISAVEPVYTSIVTAGGINIDEINQRTMESKIVPGLYFAGEIIGLHGPTGGYNLQMAFSTGWIAGSS